MRFAKGICDASGFEYPLRELVRQWDGALVHPRFLDRRHPQDFVRGIRESTLPYTRPEGPDVFIGDVPVPPEEGGPYLLLESGGVILLESGGGLLLEDA